MLTGIARKRNTWAIADLDLMAEGVGCCAKSCGQFFGRTAAAVVKENDLFLRAGHVVMDGDDFQPVGA